MWCVTFASICCIIITSPGVRYSCLKVEIKLKCNKTWFDIEKGQKRDTLKQNQYFENGTFYFGSKQVQYY